MGSSSYITDASGEVYQHDEYFPFGELRSLRSNREHLLKFNNKGEQTFVEERTDAEYTRYLFNGKELDQETGLYYYGARYYDPRISMFYGVDPMAEKYTFQSPYAYAANNPVRLIDIMGMNPDDPLSGMDKTHMLDEIKVTAKGKKSGSSILGGALNNISGLATGIKQESGRLANIMGAKNDENGGASNVAEAGIMALLGYDNLTLTGSALDEVINSPATAGLDASLIAKGKADPKFRNTAFSFRYFQVVEYGGKRAPGNMTDQFFGFWKSEYRDTWKVACNELTWLLRHASVSGWVQVNASGDITIQHNLYDVLDLSPSPGRSAAYNKASSIFGYGWHTILGASSPSINASWRSTYP